MIMYVFKILHGLVPNCGLTFQENARTGIRAIVPKLKLGLSSHVKKLRSNSFCHVAPMLYNILPNDMRRIYTTNDPFKSFKYDLDTLLSTVRDEPTVSGLTRSAKSNSVLHQMPSYIF